MRHHAIALCAALTLWSAAPVSGQSLPDHALPDHAPPGHPEAGETAGETGLDTGTANIWQGRGAAFFGVTFIDTSTEGEINGIRADETARTALIESVIATELAAQGLALVSLDPVADELARTRNPAKCNGCDLRMGQRLGADYIVTSEVQKVSNLILSMNIYVREVATGHQIRGQAVDIRGNNDESWLRGVRYIMTRNIFAP